MVKVKSAADIDAAYKAGIPGAASAYKKGVSGNTDWKEKAINSEPLYAQKVQEAVSAGRRAKALQNVSQEQWKQNASNLGAQRIGQGMEAGAATRSRNFEPYRQAIEGCQLPERTADPMTNVTNRVGGIVQALVNKKREIKG